MINRGRALQHGVGEQPDPVAQGALATLSDEHPSLVLDELGGGVTVAGGEVVPEGIGRQVVLGEPASGSAVARFDVVGRLQAQPLGEQRVISVPVSAMVERQQEQVEPLELVEVSARLLIARDGRAQ